METSSSLDRKVWRSNRESGQVMLVVLLALGIFLIGAMAFAIDLSNLWFQRQATQTAADAACTAGAMDLLVNATNGTTNQGGFTQGTAFDCQGTPTYSPCQYASLNGYNSSIAQGSANSGTLGNNVFVDFPASVPGVTAPPASEAPVAFIRVSITNNLPTFFAGMLKGLRRQSVRAISVCGIINATSPIPILVLHPTMSGSLHMNGGGSSSGTTGDIQIVGGPSKSIQVNSSSSTAVGFNGGPTINLCGGGSSYCGSSMGVWGSESAPGTNFWSTVGQCAPPHNTLCSGTQTAPQWNSPNPPIADPFATTTAPAQPTWASPITSTAGTTVGYHVNGCPDTRGCQEYTPGYYPNGIRVQNATAIFDPGLYYIGGNAANSGQCNNAGASGSMCENSGSCMRPSTAVGDGSGGTVFYFADSNSVVVGGGGGSCNPPGGNTIDPFQTTSGTGSIPFGVKCTAASQIPGNLPANLTGSVLLAPCSAPTDLTKCAPNCNLNYGDPLGLTDPVGEQRGILFFQNRSVSASNNPTWSGNGSMLLAGTMYFHQCQTGGADSGLGCVSGAYNDQLSLGGTSGSSTYVLGDIVVDQLSVGGSGTIIMDLNPSAAFTTLKASLLQ